MQSVEYNNRNLKDEIKGCVFNIQSFSLQDGPGIRTTVFMKGCNLHCYWCHNPESLSLKQELQFYKNKCISCKRCDQLCQNSAKGSSARFKVQCTVCGICTQECFAEAVLKVGYEISVDELMKILLKDKDIFKQSGGGVTFSGGEPLLQSAFLYEALKACKSGGIHTTIETALCTPWEDIEPIIPYLDLILCDIKIIDDNKHLKATGASNKIILQNIKRISALSLNLKLRVPIVPEFNDNIEDMKEIADFVLKLPNKHTIELLPFHGLCIGKYNSLNMEYNAKSLTTPTKQEIIILTNCFLKKGIIIE